MRKLLNEQLSISSTNPIKARWYDYKSFTYPWHFHSQYEIMYVDKGNGYCMIGDNMLNYEDNTLFFFGSDLPHWMQNPPSYEEDNNLRVKGVIVQFEKDFMQYSFTNYVQFAQIQNLLNLAQRGIRFDLKDNPKVQELIKHMPDSNGLEQIILLLRLFNELSFIPQKDLGASPNFDSTLAGFKDNKMEKVIAYLNKHYTHDISLDEISNFAAMNPTAFCRFFKSKTGKTFKEYIIEMRIGYACKLLAVDRLNMSQICFQCGFDSISHFNRCFKKVTGCSPSAFKEKIFKEEKDID